MKPVTKPTVELLYHTPEPEKSIYTAARLCYSEIGATELKNNIEEDNIPKLIRFLISAGHHSALEHASFTFAIENVSRALTHQLVRHRMSSPSQQSQRYVEMGDDIPFIIPPTVSANPEMLEKFEAMVDLQTAFYREMVEVGIPKEDARYVIGAGVETKIVITMNARSLLNFFEHRMCRRAQWEIRDLANQMYDLVNQVAPTVFEIAGPSCVRGACKEGKMTCGQPFERKRITK